MRARSQHGQGQSTTSDPAGTRNSSPSTCNRRLGSSFAMSRRTPPEGGESLTTPRSWHGRARLVHSPTSKKKQLPALVHDHLGRNVCFLLPSRQHNDGS